LVPRIVVIDNAGIHKGDLMEKKRRQRAKHGLYLYYLPPYSPELNRIQILWKHAKHFWRRFVARNGTDWLNEIQSLMRGFGSKFTMNLPDYLVPSAFQVTHPPHNGRTTSHLQRSQSVPRCLAERSDQLLARYLGAVRDRTAMPVPSRAVGHFWYRTAGDSHTLCPPHARTS
jgi:hypothetical protein